MTEFWLIRHGQTEWNIEGRFQGSSDVPLNQNGIAQAEQLAEKLFDNQHKFSAVYSSDLIRAIKTAEIIAERLGLDVFQNSNLREISQGEWEGQLFVDIKANYPDEILERRKNPVSFRPPGGETVGEVAARCTIAADEIAIKHPEQKVFIVSHGISIATLICMANGFPMSKAFEMIPENADPYIIEWVPSLQRIIEQ